MLLQMEWLEEVDKLRKDGENVTLETFQKYLNVGMNLPSHPVIDKYLNEIQHISDEAKRWEKKAKYCLQSKSTLALSTVEDILKEADLIPAYLPNYSSLLETVKRAQNWSYESVLLYTGDFIPYIDVLENIVNRGHNISIQFDALPFCESQLNDAKKWREKTSRIFLHKNSHYSLMEVLSPRVEMGVASFRQKKSRLNDQNIPNSNTHVINGVKLEGKVDPFLVVAAFKV
ncbi:unnamed protein product, partial [Timema podura]|nr:unnamed protein product [Timema podura]